MPEYIGDYSPPAGRFAIVVARFNALVTESLLAGCRDSLARHGVPDDCIDVAQGAWIVRDPDDSARLAASGRYAAVICLGCVIRGETAHFDHVAGQAAAGVMEAGMATGVPVIFGILTTDSVEQALNRAGLKGGNKGADAAMVALEMVSLFARLDR